MSGTFAITTPGRAQASPVYAAIIAGLACALLIGKSLPITMDGLAAVIEPLCAVSDPAGSSLDTVEPTPRMPCQTYRASA